MKPDSWEKGVVDKCWIYLSSLIFMIQPNLVALDREFEKIYFFSSKSFYSSVIKWKCVCRSISSLGIENLSFAKRVGCEMAAVFRVKIPLRGTKRHRI